ncbi:MAG: LacI family DNA-binding transcriptional regulator [Treponema sp.]|nr:LacI family DNA-binding transcriptional regulator [Treponema sp.]
MATIKQIAKMANVSVATVSNVLNGRAGAAGPEKASEIIEIAKSLNYTANVFARRLQQGKSNCIGVITEDLTVFNTPYIVDGIDSKCKENGYEMILENMRFFQRFGIDFSNIEAQKSLCLKHISSLLSKQVEGIIYIANHCREISYIPDELNVKFAYAYCYSSNKKHASVLMDDEKAGYEITKILVSKGHTKIGVICGPLFSYHTQKRLSGYQGALFDSGILYNAKNVRYGNWKKDDGYVYAKELYESGCTAIFAFNDLMAGGAEDWFRDNNIEIGKTVPIFGFDDREVSRFCSPQISTAALPLFDIGKKSAELIMNSDSESYCESFLLPCSIIERASSEGN